VIEKLTSKEYGVISSLREIGAVGHRVVHGGQRFSESVLIDDKVIDAITECIPLGPLHNPANLWASRRARRSCPAFRRSPRSIRRSIRQYRNTPISIQSLSLL
jgi:acetate kinase